MSSETSSIRNTTSSTFPLTTLNGEPRVYDLHLAERLGFERPAKIRDLIKRNLEKLNTFNHIPTVARCLNLGNGAKREVQEYYLDRKQSLFVCMKSETDRAFDVQVEIIRVFDAYLNGDLPEITPQATIAGQPRLHFALRGALRAFDLAKDAWGKQIAANQIKVLCAHLSIDVPDFALIGKPIDQYQLEV